PAHATGPRPELWVRSPALLLANAAEEGLRVRSIEPLEGALLQAVPLDHVLLQLGAVPEQRRQVPFEDLRQIQQRIELTELLLHVPRHDRRLAQGSALGQLFEGRELVTERAHPLRADAVGERRARRIRIHTAAPARSRCDGVSRDVRPVVSAVRVGCGFAGPFARRLLRVVSPGSLRRPGACVSRGCLARLLDDGAERAPDPALELTQLPGAGGARDGLELLLEPLDVSVDLRP